jgi:CSLREA domain-containing protein
MKAPISRWLTAVASLAASTCLLSAETITVSSLADSGEGSLRAALTVAANEDIIEIPLAGSIDLLSTLVIDKPVAIRGPGSGQLKIRRGEGVTVKFGVFEVRSPDVSISRLTIADGSRSEGGGIFRQTQGDLLIEDCLLIGNRQEGEGFGGGAIALRGAGHTIIRGCVIRDNLVVASLAGIGGGGVYLGGGTLLIENSSLVANTGGIYGGGLYIVEGSAELRNCTVSGNTAGRDGSAIALNGPFASLKLLASTVTLNKYTGVTIVNGGSIQVGNSIVSGNTSSNFPEFTSHSKVTSLGYNLVGRTSSQRFTAPGDVVGVTAPLLAPLGYYGGSTLIHPPTINSIHVVDKGKASLGDIGAVELSERPQFAREVTVNTTDDNDDGVPGRLHCSLREAINRVNGLARKDERIIRFDSRVFGPGKPRREIALLTALPALHDSRLEGPGAKHLTIRRAAAPAFSVLHVDGLERSFLSGVTLENGLSTYGGGIYASTPVTVEECHVRNCSARLQGGGIFCKAGGLVMKRCTLSNNTSSSGGAGLATSTAPSQIENSTFDGNRAVGGFGGGILASGQLTLTACTLTRGYAARAGGRIAASGSTETVITLRNCIVSGNQSGDVCGSGYSAYAGFVSGGYNLIGTLFYNPDFTHGVNGDLVGVTDPKLGLLKDNGGPTPTLALRPGSPAIDQGKAFDLTADQRGFTRTFDYSFVHAPVGGDETDVGAFEFQRFTLDAWRRQYFTEEQLATALAQPEGDATGSGIPNSLKHLFGIDPLTPVDASSRAALPSVSTAEEAERNFFVLSYRRSGLYSGPQELVEYSTDLVGWTPAPRFRTRITPADEDSFDQKVEVWVDMSGVGNAYLRISTPE